jgi:hypothetical protein
LQTERRTRALYEMRKPLLDEETIEQRVVARMDRQENGESAERQLQ